MSTAIAPHPSAASPTGKGRRDTTPAGSAPRVAGVDLARGVALLGMATVHVTVGDHTEPGTVGRWLLTAPSGRAAVLFFLLAGVALSIIAGRGSASARTDVLLRRGAVLLVLGLLLLATVWGGSILHSYGVMFLLAPWILRVSSTALVGLSGLCFAIGPILLTVVPEAVDAWVDGRYGVHGYLLQTATATMFGQYAIVVWAGFFMTGVALGRLELSSRRTAASMLIGGAVLCVALTLAVDAVNRAAGLAARSPKPTSDHAGFDKLPADVSTGTFTTLTPHAGSTAWALQACAIAIAVLGLCLLLPRAVQRLLWPLQALGSVSLTGYLLHLALVQDYWVLTGNVVFDGTGTQRLGTAGQVWVLLSIFAILLVVAVVVRRFWRRGPAEWVLAQLTHPTRSSESL